jgi:hypothetical protein
MYICFLYIMDQWFKRGNSSKQLSTTTASTDVTHTVIESQCFILSFSADSSTTTASTDVTDTVIESQSFILSFSANSSRTAESKNSKSMIPICLWNLCIQVMKLLVALCVLCSKVLPNSSMLPAKLHKHHYTGM